MGKSLGWARAGALAAVVAAASLGCAAETGDGGSSSDSDLTADRPHLLAIGDSMTFAWNPNLEKDPTKVNPHNYRGYAEMVAERLGTASDNIACPGEASGSFLDDKAEDNGCRKNRATYRLHYDWSGKDKQIDVVVGYLKEKIADGLAPPMIVMTLGGNDLLLVQKHCEMPKHLGLLKGPCELVRLPFAEHSYGEHIEQIVTAIDDAGYRGKVVLVKTYAPDYSDKIAKLGISHFNDELDEHARKIKDKLRNADLRVADGYGKFEERAAEFEGKTCKTGLLIDNGDGTCDIHPTAAGHELLAEAVLEAAR